MVAIARYGAVSLDCDDPRGLAEFYRAMIDGEIVFASDDFVAVKGEGGAWITMQRVADHRRPTWPDETVPKQVHLEFGVSDLESAQAAALAIGATLPSEQPSADRWRVLIDPAGHPFCLTTLIPTD